MHFSDVVFCLLPFAIVAGTVAAFVREIVPSALGC